MEGAEARAPVLRLLHGEPRSSEQIGDEPPDIPVVVDHEHAGCSHTVLILDLMRVPYHPSRE